jgi:hypothetical protein
MGETTLSTTSMAMGEGGVLRAPRTTVRGERTFWSGMAISMALVAFAGFAPSYYLKAHFALGPPLTPQLRLHGAVMTAWLLLLVTQTSLIAARRVTWHRRLGVVGVLLAAALVVLAADTAIQRAHEGILGPGMVPPLQFLSIPLMSILVLPVLIGAAVYFRKRSDYHKRLIMLANVEIVTPAIARLGIMAGFGPPLGFAVADVFILAIIARDLVTLRRVHPATIWGGLFLFISQPIRFLVMFNPTWLSFAGWLAG